MCGHSDLAIGTRLTRAPGSCAAEARVYLPLLQPAAATAAGGPVQRRQRGFKAIRRDAAPSCRRGRGNGWFFDTELLVLAERAGLRIHEVPVDGVDDPDSRADLVSTAIDDLKGVARLSRSPAAWHPAPARGRPARLGGQLEAARGRACGMQAGIFLLDRVLRRAVCRTRCSPGAARFHLRPGGPNHRALFFHRARQHRGQPLVHVWDVSLCGTLDVIKCRGCALPARPGCTLGRLGVLHAVPDHAKPCTEVVCAYGCGTLAVPRSASSRRKLWVFVRTA